MRQCILRQRRLIDSQRFIFYLSSLPLNFFRSAAERSTLNDHMSVADIDIAPANGSGGGGQGSSSHECSEIGASSTFEKRRTNFRAQCAAVVTGGGGARVCVWSHSAFLSNFPFFFLSFTFTSLRVFICRSI